MEPQPYVLLVGVLIQMIDTVGVERGSAPLDTMHLISLGEQQFGKVGTVLPGNAGDQRYFRQIDLQKSTPRPAGGHKTLV